MVLTAPRPRRGAVYGSRVVLWHCDRAGNRISPVPLVTPVSGTLNANEDAGPQRSLSLVISDPHSLQPLRDYVSPEVSLIAPDGTVTTRTMGIYLVTPPRVTTTSARVAGTIEATDLTWHLRVSKLGAVEFTGDTGAAAREIAIGAGFSPSRVAIPDTGTNFAEPYRPAPGTTRYAAMVAVLNASSWYAPWMDGAGRIVTGPWSNLQDRPTTVTITGDALFAAVSEDPDWSRLRNSVTVRNLAPDREPIWATERITNPAHPLFWDPYDPSRGIGYEIDPDGPIDDPEIPDEAAARARAIALLSQDASLYQRLRIESLPDLDASLHDVVLLSGLTGRYTPYNGRWWRRAWTMRFQGLVTSIESQLWKVQDWQ